MGDVDGLVKAVIETLTPVVSGEISLLSGLKDDVNAIKNELQRIAVFLKNAEERAEGDEDAKEWVRQVRMLAYDIEDAIERYQLFLKETAYSRTKQYLSLEVRSMASTIKGLRETALHLAKTKESYNLKRPNEQQGQVQSSAQEKLTTSYFLCTMSADHIGDDVAKREIFELLKLQEVKSTPSIIAVVGMRGLGKTTVVTSVYHDKMLKSHFTLRAWIPASPPKRHSDILRSMLLQFTDATQVPNISEIGSMDKRSLILLLRNYLKDKRYMIVFDDVQEGDTELSTYVKNVLPFNDKGSKILLTTRYENVAYTWLDGATDGLYKLKPLPFEKAWELFCKKTFHKSGGSCPSYLKDLANGIVRKCGGLPPAIISLSRLLSGKVDDIEEWEKVGQSLGFYLATNPQLSAVHKTLMQNYYDLPFYLKPCFLYFGMFPKGQPISRMRLIRLWIAEGFIIQTRGSLTFEEVAQEYVSELINMSMIEVKSTDPSGKIRSLGLVSEFLHEMILAKLEELSFCKILSKNDLVGNEKSRRLSIHGDHNSNASEFLDSITQGQSSIRSLFVIEVKLEVMPMVFNEAFFKSTNLLKVLDLFNAPIDVIPREIGMLLNLRYLSLRCTRVSALPGTIGKLENLQTLDLKQTFISDLPKEINQLRNLRHLLGYYYENDFGFCGHCLNVNGVTIPEGSLGKCLELQKLGFLDLRLGHSNWASELRCLTKLRKLGIIGLRKNESNALCSVIDEMKHLQSFTIFARSKTEIIDLGKVTSPPMMLKHLCLNGPLAVFPTWVYELHGLVKLRLRWSNLHVDPLGTLQLLPNLVELQLVEAYVGENLAIASYGFQKLKILHLLDLHALKSLSMSKGALPLLEEMSIGESRNLQVPSDIKYLHTLKTLNFYNMPSHFTNLILPGQPCNSVVNHVPNVYCHTKHPKGYWQAYTIR
ncbi:disease resistance protein RPM1-like [Silene latifolia]|uniref:disease resistance protein RPM1-like n=1 Tax=Silene latifolia TaxID=37657 RepID=UPI003D7816EE